MAYACAGATLKTRRFGRCGLEVTEVAFGGAPLGGLFTEVSEEVAREALESAWEAGIRYFDTAPLYGFGLSEQRMGSFLQTKPRDSFVVSTKVGRLLHPSHDSSDMGGSLGEFVGALSNGVTFDFSADAVKRSLEASLVRMGLDRIDIAYLHDPDDFYERALDEAYPAMHDLRDQGLLRAIGAGMNQWQMLEKFVKACDLDVVLLAGRYTLLDRSAERTLLPLCQERNVAVIAAGVFNSGILAQVSPQADSRFDYVPASPVMLERARALAQACRRYDVTLPEAAIQFPLRRPMVAGVLLGMRSAAEVAANVASRNAPIPAELWADLELFVNPA